MALQFHPPLTKIELVGTKEILGGCFAAVELIHNFFKEEANAIFIWQDSSWLFLACTVHIDFNAAILVLVEI